MVAAGFRIVFGGALMGSACTSIAADQRAFDGTSWRVAAINGRTTPATSDYYLSFDRGAIGGRVGCNNFGGRYAVADPNLKVRDLRASLMGCAEPAASFESEAFGVLSRPMRMNWASARRLDLVSDLGTIALERLP